ncbi:uncharacterized protein LOC101852184, partial [Aplysia californica]|uniref:Uncharacterized protein LOC101852184 n=1 Tax=Aplysia californica TaxID=6500 RepID=A0ABM1A1X3_APLCA
MTPAQYHVLLQVAQGPWMILAASGVIFNCLNLATFIRMGLKDCVTVSFCFQSVYDLFLFSVFIMKRSLQLSAQFRLQSTARGIEEDAGQKSASLGGKELQALRQVYVVCLIFVVCNTPRIIIFACAALIPGFQLEGLFQYTLMACYCLRLTSENVTFENREDFLERHKTDQGQFIQGLSVLFQELPTMERRRLKLQISPHNPHVPQENWSMKNAFSYYDLSCRKHDFEDYTSTGVQMLLHVLTEVALKEDDYSPTTLEVSTESLHCDPKDTDPSLDIFRVLLPSLLLLSFLPCTAALAYDMTLERAHNVAMSLDMMGVRRVSYVTSWLLFALVQPLLLTLLFTVAVCLPQDLGVLRHSDPRVVFLFFFLYGLASVTYTLFIKSLFEDALEAAAMTVVLNVVHGVPVILVLLYQQSLGRQSFLLCSLFYNCALQIGCFLLTRYEELNQGATLSTMTSPPSVMDKMSLTDVMVMFVVDILVHSGLALLTHGLWRAIWNQLRKLLLVCGESEQADGPVQDPPPQEFDGRHDRVCGAPAARHHGFDRHHGAHCDGPSPGEGPATGQQPHRSFGDDHCTPRTPGMRQDQFSRGHIGCVEAHRGHGIRGRPGALDPEPPVPDVCGRVSAAGRLLPQALRHTERPALRSAEGMPSPTLVKKEVERLMEQLDWTATGTSAQNLARIWQKRLNIAAAFAGDPQLVLVDSPATGLSQGPRRKLLYDLWQMGQGRTLVVTSESWWEAGMLADRVALLSEGKIICCGSRCYFKDILGAGSRLTVTIGPDCDTKSLTTYLQFFVDGVVLLKKTSSHLVFYVPDDAAVMLEYFLGNLKTKLDHFDVADISVTTESVEDIFSKRRTKASLERLLQRISRYQSSMTSLSYGSGFPSEEGPLVTYSSIVRTKSGNYLDASALPSDSDSLKEAESKSHLSSRKFSKPARSSRRFVNNNPFNKNMSCSATGGRGKRCVSCSSLKADSLRLSRKNKLSTHFLLQYCCMSRVRLSTLAEWSAPELNRIRSHRAHSCVVKRSFGKSVVLTSGRWRKLRSPMLTLSSICSYRRHIRRKRSTKCAGVKMKISRQGRQGRQGTTNRWHKKCTSLHRGFLDSSTEKAGLEKYKSSDVYVRDCERLAQQVDNRRRGFPCNVREISESSDKLETCRSLRTGSRNCVIPHPPLSPVCDVITPLFDELTLCYERRAATPYRRVPHSASKRQTDSPDLLSTPSDTVRLSSGPSCSSNDTACSSSDTTRSSMEICQAGGHETSSGCFRDRQHVASHSPKRICQSVGSDGGDYSGVGGKVCGGVTFTDAELHGGGHKCHCHTFLGQNHYHDYLDFTNSSPRPHRQLNTSSGTSINDYQHSRSRAHLALPRGICQKCLLCRDRRSGSMNGDVSNDVSAAPSIPLCHIRAQQLIDHTPHDHVTHSPKPVPDANNHTSTSQDVRSRTNTSQEASRRANTSHEASRRANTSQKASRRSNTSQEASRRSNTFQDVSGYLDAAPEQQRPVLPALLAWPVDHVACLNSNKNANKPPPPPPGDPGRQRYRQTTQQTAREAEELYVNSYMSNNNDDKNMEQTEVIFPLSDNLDDTGSTGSDQQNASGSDSDDDLQSEDEPIECRQLIGYIKHTGPCLLMVQAQALWSKYATWNARRVWFPVLQLLCPVVAILFFLSIPLEDTEETLPVLDLTPSSYPPSISFYSASPGDARVEVLLDKYKQFFPPGHKYWLEYIPKIHKDQIDSRSHVMPWPSSGDLLLSATHFSTQETWQGGLHLQALLLYNGQSPRSEPIALTTVLNSVLTYRRNFSIPNLPFDSMQVSIKPLPLKRTESDRRFSRVMSAQCLRSAMALLVALSFFSSSLVFLPLQERQNGMRHLLVVMGARSSLLYCTSFTWDMCIHITASFCAFATLQLLPYPTYGIYGDLTSIFSLLLLHGVANIPLIYVVQLLFTSVSLCYCTTLFLQVFLGVTFLVLKAEWYPRANAVSSALFDQWWLDVVLRLVSPGYSVADALYTYCTVSLTHTHCSPLMHLCLQQPSLMCCPAASDKRPQVVPLSANVPPRDGNLTDSYSLPPLAAEPGVNCGRFCLPFSQGHANADRNSFYLCIFTALGGWLLWTVAYLLTDWDLGYRTWKCLQKMRKKPPEEKRPERKEDEDVERERMYIESGNWNEPIVLKNLTKLRLGHRVVDNVSVCVGRGDCLCVLGLPGSGKTSLMEMVVGATPVSEGQLFFYSCDGNLMATRLHSGMGYCPERGDLNDKMTGRDLLWLVARLRGIKARDIAPAVHAMLDTLHLSFVADVTCRRYSESEKRKLRVALAFIGDSRLVVLDEPTRDLDITDKRVTWQLVRLMMTLGRVVVIATSDPEECERVSTRTAILCNGRLKALAPTDQLVSRFGGGYTVRVSFCTGEDGVLVSQEPFLNAMVETYQFANVYGDSETLRFHFPDVNMNLSKLFSVLEDGKSFWGVEEYSVQLTGLAHVLYKLSISPQLHTDQEHGETADDDNKDDNNEENDNGGVSPSQPAADPDELTPVLREIDQRVSPVPSPELSSTKEETHIPPIIIVPPTLPGRGGRGRGAPGARGAARGYGPRGPRGGRGTRGPTPGQSLRQSTGESPGQSMDQQPPGPGFEPPGQTPARDSVPPHPSTPSAPTNRPPPPPPGARWPGNRAPPPFRGPPPPGSRHPPPPGSRRPPQRFRPARPDNAAPSPGFEPLSLETLRGASEADQPSSRFRPPAPGN